MSVTITPHAIYIKSYTYLNTNKSLNLMVIRPSRIFILTMLPQDERMLRSIDLGYQMVEK